MRILLLSTYFEPDTAANGILMAALVKELARQGHRVTVVTSVPHYENNSILESYRNRMHVRERQSGIDIHRLYIYVPKRKESLGGRLLNYLSFNVLSTLACLVISRHDVLLAPSPPLTNGVAGWIVSRLKRTPLVYNVQDIYPDVAIKLGILKNPRAIKAFFAMEQFVYAKSAAVSVISHGFQKNLIRKGIAAEKAPIIQNFVDSATIEPRRKDNAFSRDHGVFDRFVVLFAGNVGLSQGLETVLEAARLLKDRQEIVFYIVGNGASKPGLVEKAQQMALDNVRFLPYQPYPQIPDMYGAADICLVPLRKGLTQDSVPSKVWTIMGAGRPILAAVDRESDTYDVIQEAQCGLCVAPEDPGAMAAAVRRMQDDEEQARKMGENGRDFVLRNYTVQEVARKYLELFERLTATPEETSPSKSKAG